MNTQKYDELNEQLGTRDSRKLENNTYLQRRENGIAVHYHNTDVLLFTSDGRVVLDSGGYETYTTRDRMDSYLPGGIRCYIKDRRMKVVVAGEEIEMVDGMVITLTDDPAKHTYIYPKGAQGELAEREAREKRVTKAVKGYLDGLTPAIVKELTEKKSTGDECWVCSFELQGQTPQSDHLLGHLDEQYYCLVTLLLALKDAGYKYPPLSLETMSLDPDLTILRRTLRKFFLKRLTGKEQ